MTAATVNATTSPHTDADPLLTPSEVAALFRVDPKTVTRWAQTGRIACIRTLGGHRRYPAGRFATALTPTTQAPTTQAPSEPTGTDPAAG